MTYCITNSNPLSNLIGVTYCGLVLMQTHTLFWGNRKLVRELVLVRHDELWILWDESDNHRWATWLFFYRPRYVPFHRQMISFASETVSRKAVPCRAMSTLDPLIGNVFPVQRANSPDMSYPNASEGASRPILGPARRPIQDGVDSFRVLQSIFQGGSRDLLFIIHGGLWKYAAASLFIHACSSMNRIRATIRHICRLVCTTSLFLWICRALLPMPHLSSPLMSYVPYN